MSAPSIPLGIYRHYKGAFFEVLAVALDATNDIEGAPRVVYRSVTDGRVWTCGLESFSAKVVAEDGTEVLRFAWERATDADDALDAAYARGCDDTTELIAGWMESEPYGSLAAGIRAKEFYDWRSA